MPSPSRARTGLLLFLAAGPILVFFFLYTFGKNKYTIDTYSLKLPELVAGYEKVSEPLLVLDTSQASQTLKNERNRMEAYWDKISSRPRHLELDSRSATQKPGFLGQAGSWVFSDTTVEIETVKGKSLKRLPPSPRAFLFDADQILRGVYGLEQRKSVDTLLLEYQILIAK